MEDSLPSNIFQNSFIDDSEFWMIFFQTVKKLLNFEKESNARYLNRYYEFFKKHFNKYFGINLHPDHPYYESETVRLLKDSLYYRIVYVLRNSPILSSAVAFHFKNVLVDEFSYFEKLIKNQKIKICSIGGGAASDIVAVVKILDSIAIKQLDFRITVIDSVAHWKNTCFTVLSCLKNFHGATWKINFVQADISDKNSFSVEVIKSIQDADLVLMVMLLYDFKNENLDAKETVQNVSELMQCGSMLFLLDMELIEYIPSCFGLSGETEECHLVYENLSDFHILDAATSYNARKIYKKHSLHLGCTNGLPVFVRAWIKTPTNEISGIRSELRHRFKKNIERYDPELIFRDRDFFESLIIKRVDRKRKAGYSTWCINEYLQEKRLKRIYFLNKLTKTKKKLETARKTLAGENVQLEEEEHNRTNNIDEEVWEEYITQKKAYTYTKRNFYEDVTYDRIYHFY